MGSLDESMQAPRLLLCTDLDRTLIPNGPQPETAQAREYFAMLVAQPQVTLAYVTGRHRQLVEQAIEQYDLPRPDFVIADVGSSVYRLSGNDWEYQPAWERLISTDWRGNSAEQLHGLMAGIDHIQLQEAEKQNSHKLSYYVALNVDRQAIMAQMRDRLAQHSIAAHLIWSVDEAQGVGLLDVLPASAGKRQAIEFLIQQLGYAQAETVFAGDSGNDIDVLCSPVQSVLVANADRQVRDTALACVGKHRREASLYLASGDFMQMNGNYSAGILEGVAHFIPAARLWMRGEA